MDELIKQLEHLEKKAQELLVVVNIPSKKEEMQKLEEEMSLPGFWDDSQKAQEISGKHAQIQKNIREWEETFATIVATRVMAQDDAKKGEDGLLGDYEVAYRECEKKLGELEIGVLLNGEYDDHNAILSLHAGTGGTDAMDWAGMLLRMYARFCERHGYKTTLIAQTQGEEAGIKSATLLIQGDHAFGYLRSEHGVHRLVRISPFDAEKMRHTSFALVEVMPEMDEVTEFAIDPKDLRLDTFLASGKGGQNVQKNETAVRLTHIPTGIAVACQSERSQAQNKQMAMKVLIGKLTQLKYNERKAEADKIRGEYQEAVWGNQIRSYVLHPYHQVKDHRTDWESTDPDAVLDGDLLPVIESYLREEAT